MQSGIIHEACGISYSMFVKPSLVGLKGKLITENNKDTQVESWMELIKPTTAEVLAYFDHPQWGE